MNNITREAKINRVAEAFMRDDPEQYKDLSLEDVVLELSQASDDFIENAFNWFCVDA